MSGYLGPFEHIGLEKVMLGRGIDYDTIQLIFADYNQIITKIYPLLKCYKK